MPSVATEGKNPVWLPSGHHVIARNQDDDHAARIECPHENRFVHWSQVAGDIERLRLTLERELCHPHDAALVGGFGGVEEIGAGVADIDLGLEAVALERDRHAVGLAAARSRGHEDGGGLAPKLKLEGGRRLECSIGPAQRHHDAGRPAGEFGGLVKIRRRERERG